MGSIWSDLLGDILDSPRTTLAEGAEPGPTPYAEQVPAADQAVRLLFSLAGSPRGRRSLSDLCRETGIYKSKGYYLLNTLQRSGLVMRYQDTKAYALGPGVLALSRAFLDHTDPGEVAAPYLERLAETTRCTALMGLITADQVFVVAQREAPAGFGMSIRVGHRYPLTWGAHGKAVVAFLPPAERDAILAQGSPLFYGEAGGAARDSQAVRDELDEVARLGYATDEGAMQQGINAVSAPVLDDQGRPGGCLLVVGAFALSSAALFGEQVAAAARGLSIEVGPLLGQSR